MKYTLLQMTQEILSSMDSDEVNSINDTTEAQQVARCIRQAYYDLIDDLDPPEHYSMFELTDSGDNAKPTLMTVPADINLVRWVKYNKIANGETAPNYQYIEFLPMDDFLRMMYNLNIDESNIASFDITIDSDSIAVNYINDHSPTYYTCFGDDNTLIFDSYDVAVDTRLAKAKTICYGKKLITFSLSDSTTPDLDEPYFVRLLNEAKLLTFAELKSTDHAIANRNARRSRTKSEARKYRVKKESYFDQLPNFSRKG